LEGLVALGGYGLSCTRVVRGHVVQTLPGPLCETSSRLQLSVSPSMKPELVDLRRGLRRGTYKHIPALLLLFFTAALRQAEPHRINAPSEAFGATRYSRSRALCSARAGLARRAAI